MASSADIFDVVVVGAGPAGLAGARSALKYGARTAVLDAGSAPGGQYWRHPAGSFPSAAAALSEGLPRLHHDLASYRRLLTSLRAVAEAGGYFPQHHVWAIVREAEHFEVLAADRSGGPEKPVAVGGRRLVLAPGAFDRQLPFPGWELPGVMTAGGVQALLKGNGVVAGARVVVAGTGPFLLPVAAGLAESGAQVVEVCEAAAGLAWARHPGAVLRNLAKIGEGSGYARTLLRHRIPLRARSAVVAARGGTHLDHVVVARLDARGKAVAGSERELAADVLAVGWGFTPSIELPLQLGCSTRRDVDGSTVCVVDRMQRSSVPGVFIAGEACGVGGAGLAVIEGMVAGAAAAGANPLSTRLERTRDRLRRFATAMHDTHPVPGGWIERLAEDTLICRCEEVSLAALRRAAGSRMASDVRTAKLVSRIGMGWCQGRICGYPAACILAEWTGRASPVTLDARPVAGPVRLGTVADSG